MRVLLVHGPRKFWPFIHEQDNYLVPQNLICLAAFLRREKIDVKVLDCLPLHIGYKSLAREIIDFRPDVVAVGENHSMYASEALKVLRLAKSIDRDIVTIAGGTHFANTIEWTLSSDVVDYVVIGEGEVTLLELLQHIEGGASGIERVKGIAFRREEQIIITEPRGLIDDLNTLPMPAYDMLPMHLYGKSDYLFSPGGTTIHHSRGCTGRCSFCAFWVNNAERRIENGRVKLIPRFRTKSPQYTVEEVEYLYRVYKKQMMIFVDDSFNLLPEWNDEFAGLLIKKNLPVQWFAFMRADCLLRDEKNGILEKMVRSGLVHICIGIERSEKDVLESFNKKFYKPSITEEIISIFKRKYPQVFLQGTFIVGHRGESRESLLALGEYAKRLGLDFPAFHPLTPVPGTIMYDEAITKGWLKDVDFEEFDWSTPVMDSEHLTREEILDLMAEITSDYIRPRWILKGLTSKYRYKRNMYLWWLLVSLKVGLRNIYMKMNPLDPKNYHILYKPSWYNK
ncbi:MAG: B12-binding domain-containing radical SAM protein [Myxococcota bacterium]